MTDEKTQILKDYQKVKLPVSRGEVREEVLFLSMRDGARLKTHIFHMEQDKLSPDNTEKTGFSVILQRSPYPQAEELYRTHGEQLARRGFVYVLQWCRGIGGSGGNWNPNENERADGLDTVQYLSSCEWVKNIGFWGDSYLALTGWCMADAVPDKVKGMYLGVYGTERFKSMYEKRSFRPDVFTSWAMKNAGIPVGADYRESYRFRPQTRVDEALWGIRLPWYEQWITSVRETDPYWQGGFWKLLGEIPEKVKIPVWIREGWYDHHLGSAMEAYAKLNPKAKEHSVLEVGCWNHESKNVLQWCQAEHWRSSEVETMTEWFELLLHKEQLPKPDIRLYVIGEDRWIHKVKWPDFTGKNRKVYLSGAHLLTRNLDEEEEIYSYFYDPENPVESIGTESMLHDMGRVGSQYQPAPGYRQDVISFLSEPLEEDVLISGRIRVCLTVSSDCEDTAFTAKLMEEKEAGQYVNIRSSITTIAADCKEASYKPGEKIQVWIEMWDIVWKLSRGKRIRLDISSSDFPQYTVHTNYPGIWAEQKESRVAQQKLFTGGEASFIELPLEEN